MRKISYEEGVRRGFTVDEAYEVINDALGNQYKLHLLKNNQIWANEASGMNDQRSDRGTAKQRAFNRIMKKISLEDGNEHTSLYRDVIDRDTRENQVIDWAVQNNILHNNVKQFLNKRAGGRDSIKQSETPNDKVARTIKERLSGIDSHTGADINNLKTNVGHIYAAANHPEMKHYFDNTREEPGIDNMLYSNLEGDALFSRNQELLQQSVDEGVDVKDFEKTINRQMYIETLNAEDQPKAMVALGMAEPNDVGLPESYLNTKEFKQIKNALKLVDDLMF